MKTQELLYITYHTNSKNFLQVTRLDEDIISINIGDPDKCTVSYLLDQKEVDALLNALNQKEDGK